MNKENLCNYLAGSQTESGGIKFSNKSSATLLSTSFAVMNLYGFGQLDSIDREKAIAFLKQGYDATSGLFRDPLFKIDDCVGSHQLDYIELQSTYFSTMALDVLGVHFSKLPFLEKFLNKEYLHDYLQKLDWSKFWYESNKIMFLLYFLSYQHLYGEQQEETFAAIQAIFDELDKRQDPNTGFWGTDLNGNDTKDGAYGAAHIYLFYEYWNRELRYLDKIIDNSLTLHHKNGLSPNRNGGACEDYDMVDIYYRILKRTDYRKTDVMNMLATMKRTIETGENPMGGFSYRIETNPMLLAYKRLRVGPYRMSGWSKMKTSRFYPDTWGTWFRSLAIGVIEQMQNNESNLKSYHLPAWGFVQKQR